MKMRLLKPVLRAKNIKKDLIKIMKASSYLEEGLKIKRYNTSNFKKKVI